MPRDDLSIDFVNSRMPQGGEALDPALILEDWINRVANLPEEIRFLLDEVADRDRQVNECIRIIEERDGRLQKFIKANGSHEVNPREEGYRKTIVENFNKADALAKEKIALTQKMMAIMDRHTRQIDMQIKQLYDRGEPGFTDPDELPSILRSSAANQAVTPARTSSMASPSTIAAAAPSSSTKDASKASASSASVAGAGAGVGGGAGASMSVSGSGRSAANAQVRQAQIQQGLSSSAPASPAATMIMGRQARENSAGPGPGTGKRGPRASIGLANAPPNSSGLARHASLGPGTPKSHQTVSGVQRAGSAGPRASAKGAGAGPGRKSSTPLAASGSLGGAAGSERASGPGRKKSTLAAAATKSALSRRKRHAKAASAESSTADSELSEADSSSGSDASSRRATPARSSSQTGGAESGPRAHGTSSGNKGNGSGAGSNEGPSHPLVKRERDSTGGGSGSLIGTSAGASGSHSGPGSGAGAGHGSSGAGGSGGAVTKHGPGGRGVGKGAPSSDDRMDIDDEEAGDDRKYCLCQKVSFGDMVACDNEDCPFEWFHWSCVGLKSEPNGTWYCPVCTEKMKGSGAHVGGSHHSSRAGGSTRNAGAGPNSEGAAGSGAGAGGAAAGGATAAAGGGGGSGAMATTKKGK